MRDLKTVEERPGDKETILWIKETKIYYTAMRGLGSACVTGMDGG